MQKGTASDRVGIGAADSNSIPLDWITGLDGGEIHRMPNLGDRHSSRSPGT
ncbi:MAG TPA: hypothetical protein V6C65_11980 [Allocoleopsis sp.]